MNGLRRFVLFWYDFVVGDDWLLAVGVVVGLCLSALAIHHHLDAAWWILPSLTVCTLAASLWRAAHIAHEGTQG